MDNPNESHRPLLAGLKITSSVGHSGTLTGLATRRADGKRVLVTCLHVVTGPSLNPSEDETIEIYQGDRKIPSYKVGKLLDWIPRRAGPGNIGDFAIAELGPGVEASFRPHNQYHNMGVVLAGAMDPEVGATLTVVGAQGGIGPAIVDGIEEDFTTYAGTTRVTYNKTVTRLNTVSRPIESGDSGSPCLVPDGDNPGYYRMSCVILSGRNIPSANQGFAFPASIAEKQLGIVFGRQNQISERVTEEGEQGRGGGKEPEQGYGSQPGDRGPGGHRRVAYGGTGLGMTGIRSVEEGRPRRPPLFASPAAYAGVKYGAARSN